MSQVKTKNTNQILLVLVIALVVAAGLFFFLRSGDSVTEEMVVNRAREEMALFKPYMNMEAETITADVSKREITYSNVKVSVPGISEIAFVLDSIVQTGIDADSYAGKPGDLTSIDTQIFKGIKIQMYGPTFATANEYVTLATVDEYVYEGFKLNYRDMLKVLRENQTDSPEKITAKLMPLFSTYQLDHFLFKNMQLNYQGVVAGIGGIEAENMTMTSSGPWHIADMQVSVEGEKVFSMDKLGSESMLLPQILADLMADPEGYIQKNPEVLGKASTDPLSLLAPLQFKNFYIDNLMINTGSPLTFRKLAGDLDLSAAALVFKSSLEDLVISRALLASNPDLRGIAEAVTSDLHLNGVFDFSMGNQGDPIDLTLRAGLNETSLGGMDASIALDTPKALLYSGESDPAVQRLKSFELSAENKGIIDFVVACYAAMEYMDYDQVYGDLLDDLYSGLETAENKVQQDAMNAMIKLVEEGGTLKMSLNPATPISLEQLSETSGDAFERLGGNISYTPLN